MDADDADDGRSGTGSSNLKGGTGVGRVGFWVFDWMMVSSVEVEGLRGGGLLIEEREMGSRKVP